MNTKYMFSSVTIIGIVSLSPITRAQTYQPSNRIPVADNSRIGTQVSGTNNNFAITGGVKLGQRLFHSFQDFSVPTNGAVTFFNPVGNQSIITRVTGSSFSDINGVVNTQGANFLLINPNGIVFGTNAQLNVGRAFLGSTANGIDLADAGGATINFGTNRNGDDQLLTINPNALFNVSRLNMGGGNGQISNFGTLQTNNPNQYIGLIGGNVTMNGGKIIAPGGRVELGGMSVAGTVTLGIDGNASRVQFPADLAYADVLMTNQAGVSVAGAGAGDISINARNVEMSEGSVFRGGIETGLGAPGVVAGDIKVNATNSLMLSNSGIINLVNSNSQGNGGNVTIDTGSVSLREGARLSASTFGNGDAGSVKVKAKNAVSLMSGQTAIFSTVEPGGVGKGGNIDITAGSLSIQDGAQVQTLTREALDNIQLAGKGDAGNITVKVTGAVDFVGTKNNIASGIVSSVGVGTEGNAGNIKVDAGSLSLRNGAKLSAVTGGKGNAGNINVKVTDAIKLEGKEEGSVSQIRTFVDTGAIGNGGNITIDSASLSLKDGAQFLALTFGKGDAGNVTVTAKDAVSLTNAQTAIFSTVEAGGVGKGGNIKIDAGSLSLQDGAQLLASTREAMGNQPAGEGNAGNIAVTVAGAVDIAGNKNGSFSGIASLIDTGAKGNGGNITIDAGSFSLRDGARLSVSTFGKGNSGDINVKAREAVVLVGGQQPTAIFSSIEPGGVGKGGNIDITAGSLSIQDGAQVQTLTRESLGNNQPAGEGNAGNVTVKVTGSVDIVGSKNGAFSGIISSVEKGTEGNGGNITIDAGSFSLRDGTRLEAITEGKGNAGTIIVNATDFVTIAGKTDQFFSGLFATSLSPTGTAGDIFVTSPKINLDRGILESVSLSGNGGNIQIGGELPAQSTFIQGSKINPSDTNLLSLRRGAQISTNAGGTLQQGGNGGNITITAPNGFIVTAPNENSDISANGFSGSGGKVTINTQQNFWISPLSRAEVEKRLGTTDPNQLNPARLNTNDITAISQVNPNLSGQVSITPPQIDITAGLSPLPNNVTDPTNQINPNCSAKAIANNSFTSIGRGGIPATPKDPLNEQEIATNWVRINPQDTFPSTPIAATPASSQPIVEAQGWRRERNGDIVLVAGSSLRTLPRQGQSPSGCVGQ